MRTRAVILLAVISTAVSIAGRARAEDASSFDGAAPPSDRPTPDAERVTQPAPRPWLYLDDPTTPRPLAVTVHSGTSYTNSPASAKPFAFDIAHRGAVLEAGADVGLLPWLALTATGYGSGADGTAAAYGGLRVSVLPRGSATHLVLGGGGQRDLAGSPGVWGSAAFEQDIGRLRMGTTARVSHSFATGRDAVDLTASAGASYGVTGPLRAGLEWIGTDLEGAVDNDEAEGGIRHFAGPTLSVELLDRRLTVVGGPAFGLSRGAPPAVGRLSVAYAF